jgi:dipeptidyl aminopeptidase/acylaminoacyl peptidase
VSEATDRLTQALANRYRIERELGAGGMATVYLAEDLKHDRKVALKVLRPELAAVIGAERFLQEIKVTANLQHSHILPLYDSGSADGLLFYVMPYVEGETLRATLDREKQLGVEDAIALTRAIAGALEHAHRQGVIHRDIKPENILLRDGDPLIADFGIALALSHAGGSRLTETGLSIGTPHYMSPEQAMGDRELDARSDVYSLGAMLYEMLAGDPPYTGSTAQAIVAKVITEKAPLVSTLRDTVPEHVSAAIARALNKLPADRFPTAYGFAQALVRPDAAAMTAARSIGAAPPNPARSRLAWGGWGIAAVATAMASWFALRPAPQDPVSRYSVLLPADQRLAMARGTRIAFAPDGSQLAYIGPADLGLQIWLRPRDALVATPLPGTDQVDHVFFAPDGRRVGFLNQAQRLMTASLSGGPPMELADTAVGLDGATWSADGYIYFDGFTGGGTNGLRRVPENGGPSVVVTTVDTAAGETDHVWPTALPDGRGVLFVVSRGGNPMTSDIAVLPPDADTFTVLVRAVAAAYAPSGHLLYVTADGSLMAVPFDLDGLRVTGEPVAIGTGVGIRPYGATDLAVAGDGTVAYLTGKRADDPSEVVWVGLDGLVELIDPAWVGSFSTLAVSPDGKRLAVSVIASGDEQLWIKELPRGPMTKLTFDGSLNWRPAWLPDGRTVSFTSDRSGSTRIMAKRADGSVPAEVVLELGSDATAQEAVWHPRERWLVYRQTPRDIYAISPTGDTVPIVATPFEERAPALSPDGRWLAYQSDESGRFEVYVRPFPNSSSGKWQISTDGGIVPRWSPDGRALYYLGPTSLMAVEVGSGVTFTPGNRRALFSTGFLATTQESSYDIMPDGRRFVMIRNRTSAEDAELIVVENVGRALQSRSR